MDYELELTKANRLKLAKAFRHNKRVDFSIECAIEGQMGQAFVDDLARPAAYCINVGPFWYFAGDAHSPGGRRLMQSFPAYNLLMPSPADWPAVAGELYGDHLKSFPRHTLSAAQLSGDHLARLLAGSPLGGRVVPVSADLARQLAERPDGYFDFSDFDSAEDFVDRGLGYTILEDGEPVGVA
jgi:hypothetical protein